MTHLVDLRGAFSAPLLAPQSLAAGAANGPGVDVSGTTGPLCVAVNAGAFSGTNPTLDVKIQESSDNSTFSDVTGASITQMTAAGLQVIQVVNGTRQYVRVVATVGGTATPTALAAVTAFAQQRVSPSNLGGSSVSPQA